MGRQQSVGQAAAGSSFDGLELGRQQQLSMTQQLDLHLQQQENHNSQPTPICTKITEINYYIREIGVKSVQIWPIIDVLMSPVAH